MPGDFENDSLGGAATNVAGLPAADQNLIDDADDANSNAGKHMLLMVPDFTNTEEAAGPPLKNTTPMNSYLRLGMADSRALDPTQVGLGQDLALKVVGFADDIRNRGTTQTAPAEAPGAPNNAGNYAAPTTTQTNEDFRVAESLRLHTKGGWRDHSDGNRITTTRGDKVEVIRGNYKLVVLGRAGDASGDIGNAVGYDMSGGMVDTDTGDLARPSGPTDTPAGLNISYEWVQDTDNNFRWHVTTIQGGTAPIDNVSGTESNPSINTQTWAYDVVSETTANTVNTTVTTSGDNNTTLECTNGNVTNTSRAENGTNTIYTRGSSVSNTTFADDNITSTLAANTLTNNMNALNIASDTTALAQESVNLSLLNLGLSVQGAQVGVTVGGALLSGTFALCTITEMANLINITNWNGMVLDAHQGLHADNHAGMHIDNHSGIHMDLHTGAHFSQDQGVKIESLTGTQLTDILGPNCHMLTQPIEITETNKIEVAAAFMRL